MGQMKELENGKIVQGLRCYLAQTKSRFGLCLPHRMSQTLSGMVSEHGERVKVRERKRGRERDECD